MKVPTDPQVERTVADLIERSRQQAAGLLSSGLLPSGWGVADIFNLEAGSLGEGGKVAIRIQGLVNGARLDLKTLERPWTGLKGDLLKEAGAGAEDLAALVSESFLTRVLREILHAQPVCEVAAREVEAIDSDEVRRRAYLAISSLEQEHRKFVAPVRWVVRGLRLGLIGVGVVNPGFYLGTMALALAYVLVVTGDMLDSGRYLTQFWEGPAARVRRAAAVAIAAQ